MPELLIHLLGSFQVTLRGQIVSTFESDKTRALLAYLAVEAHQAHRRERLAGMLWPHSSERAARTNLRHILSNLRHSIGDRGASPPFLQITRQTLQLKQDSRIAVDVSQFSTLISAQSQTKRPQYVEATALYRGPFLDGFSLAGSPDFEEWLLVTREQLARQMLAALKSLTEHYEQQAQYQQALPYAWQRIDLDPWQEAAHQSLMRLLAQTGQRSLAVVQYQTCRRILAEELGVEPTPETVALYESILSGSLNDTQQAEYTAAPTQIFPLSDVTDVADVAGDPLSIPHNLPGQLTSFVGRETEIAQLKQRLLEPECRLLSLVGVGGVGKTRLSLAVAQTFLDIEPKTSPFVDGVYFISLVSLSHADDLITAIAEAIGFHFDDGRDPKTQLLAYLSNKTILLILDNFEHLLSGATEITDLLFAAPKLTVLVTSRTSLGLYEEWLYPLEGLNLPPPLDVLTQSTITPVLIDDSSAIQLFNRRAQQIKPDFDLTPESLNVAHICHLVDGLPLGIELAATWIKTFSCGTIIQEIENTLAFLTTTHRNMPNRHQSLQAVFAHSWKLLSDEAQQVLARLSVFPADFTQGAAKSIAEAPLTILHTLIDQSLLQAHPAERYQLHPLFREFAAGKLAERPQDQINTQARHSHYYLAWLSPLLPKLQNASAATTTEQIQADYDNARLAVTWALEQPSWAQVSEALDTLFFYLKIQGRYQEGERLCSLVEQSGLPETLIANQLIKIKASTWQGYFHHRLGKMVLAKQYLEESLTQLAQSGLQPSPDTQTSEALAAYFLGDLEFDSNRAKARDLVKHSLRLFRVGGNLWGESEALHTLGWITKFGGQTAEAQEAFEACLTLKRTLGDEAGMAEVLSSLAQHLVAVSADSFAVAEQYVQESLHLRQAGNHQPGIAAALAGLGEIGMWSGNYNAAEQYFQQSIAAYQDIGAGDSNLATRCMSLGWIKMHLGDYEAAFKQAQRSLEAGERLQSQFVTAFALFLQGCTALAIQNVSYAEQVLDRANIIFAALEQMDEVAGSRAAQAIAAIQSGHPQAAGSAIVEAIQKASAMKTIRPYYYALPATALYLAESQPLLAIEVYAAALNCPHVANSRWFADVVGRTVEDQAAQLPEELVTAAKQRGREKPLAVRVAEILEILDLSFTMGKDR